MPANTFQEFYPLKFPLKMKIWNLNFPVLFKANSTIQYLNRVLLTYLGFFFFESTRPELFLNVWFNFCWQIALKIAIFMKTLRFFNPISMNFFATLLHENLYVSSKRDITSQKQFGDTIILETMFFQKMPENSNSMNSYFFMLGNIWYHHFTWSGPSSHQVVNFVPIVGPWGPELNWNKCKAILWIRSTSDKMIISYIF